VKLLRPAIFYPICIIVGILLGFGVIASGIIPPNAGVPTTTAASRNLERTNTLKSVAAALTKYKSDHQQLPYILPSTLTEICITGGDICANRHLVDLSYLVNGGYLESLPNDPVGGHTEYGTGYLIAQTGDGTLYLKAARAEDGKVVELVK
jgi:hypothetical protein